MDLAVSSGYFAFVIRMNTIVLGAGDAAPDFSGTAVGAEFGDGNPMRLSNYFDGQIVLYFYPQDHTPGSVARSPRRTASSASLPYELSQLRSGRYCVFAMTPLCSGCMPVARAVPFTSVEVMNAL